MYARRQWKVKLQLLSSLTCEMCHDNEEAALNVVLLLGFSWLKSS
jgi:hypothetical protein